MLKNCKAGASETPALQENLHHKDGENISECGEKVNGKKAGIAGIQAELTPENLKLYRDIFKGREDAVPRFWKSKRGDGKAGYTPLCSNQWDEVLCNLKKGNRGGCGTCKNQDLVPLHDGHISRLIMGGKDSIIGVYPLLDGNICHFTAADFDKHKPTDPDPWEDVQRYIDTCEINDIPVYVVRSKSGKGYHVYIFFQGAVIAWKARSMAFALLREAGVIGDDVDINSFDRLFPNQDKLSGKGLGNLISLPFQGGAGLRGHTLFLDPATDYQKPYADQWEFLRNIEKVSPGTLDVFLKDWDITEPEPPKRAGAKDFKPHVEQEAKAVFSRIKNACKFMGHWCRDASELTEPEWYAGLTIVARCKDGRRQAHKYSSDHVGYVESDTDQKIEHALTDTGPYLCKTIQDSINGKYCKGCPHRGKISTPLRLGEQVANDDLYIKVIADMNKKHGVIMIGGKCHILNEIIEPTFNRPDISLSSPGDFKNFYANKKIPNPENPDQQTTTAKYWFEHQNRKEFDGLVFDPAEKTPPNYYNLWRGFAVEPVAGDWSLFRDHIKNVITNGDPKLYAWVMAWLARIFQDPGGNRPGTSIVLRGKQGTGKGIFVNTIGEILGRHFIQIAQAGQITGRFNSHLKDVILAFVDEGFWAGDKQGEGALKNIITEPFITIEQKGKDIIKVVNHVNLVIASNNDRVIPAGLDERRALFIDIPDTHHQDHVYFCKIAEQMKNGGVEAMLFDLLQWDITSVNLREAIQSKGLFEQKLHSMDTVQKYWLERLTEGTLRPPVIDFTPGTSFAAPQWVEGARVDTRDQYNDYLTFAEILNDKYTLTDRQLWLSLKKLCTGATTKRERAQGGHRSWVRVFPSLDKCRAEFESMVKTSIDWGDDDRN